jgi:hypothetical protein
MRYQTGSKMAIAGSNFSSLNILRCTSILGRIGVPLRSNIAIGRLNATYTHHLPKCATSCRQYILD